jgi:hypothetical protein
MTRQRLAAWAPILLANLVVISLAAFWINRKNAPTPAPAPQISLAPALPAHCDRARSLALPPGDYAGLAIDSDGNLWTGNKNSLLKFAPDGTLRETIKLEDTILAVATEDGQTVFAAGRNQVFRVVKTAGGWQTTAWEPFPESSYICSLAVAQNRLLIADAGRKRLLAMDPESGKSVWESAGETGFTVPSPYFAVSQNADGTLWVVNPGQHRLESYAIEDGRYLSSWEPLEPAFTGCCNPALMVALTGDRFVTMNKGSLALQGFASSGARLARLAREADFVVGPFRYALALDKQENIWLLDDRRQMILFFPATLAQEAKQ